jgi:hypothetical protein
MAVVAFAKYFVSFIDKEAVVPFVVIIVVFIIKNR